MADTEEDNPNILQIMGKHGGISVPICKITLVPLENDMWGATYDYELSGYMGGMGFIHRGPHPYKKAAFDEAAEYLRAKLQPEADPTLYRGCRSEANRLQAVKILAWLDEQEIALQEEIDGPAQGAFVF